MFGCTHIPRSQSISSMPANLPPILNPDIPFLQGQKLAGMLIGPIHFISQPTAGNLSTTSSVGKTPMADGSKTSAISTRDQRFWRTIPIVDLPEMTTKFGIRSVRSTMAPPTAKCAFSRAYRVLKEPTYRASFDRALNYCLAAQYPNGGWPQRYPLQNNYGARITFNDGAMTGVMAVLRDIYEQKSDFAFCSAAQRQQAKEAFDRGVNCILNCQYMRNGKLTVWGQQHDEHTFALASGRAFELAGLTANESADILELLEGIKNPEERIRNSIEAAYAWFESSKIIGKRIDFVQGVGRTMVDDPTAPPLWARFYDPETNQPFVAGRDGVAHARLDQILPERRNGYNWFSIASGRKAEGDYQAWKTRFALPQPSTEPAK